MPRRVVHASVHVVWVVARWGDVGGRCSCCGRGRPVLVVVVMPPLRHSAGSGDLTNR